MPAKSKAQFRLMAAAASGKKTKAGISRKAAKEYISGQFPKNLPERKKRRS